MDAGPEDQERLMTAYQTAAAQLIRDRPTLVLATGKNDQPWCAPVYFVYMPPGFYFYSSPNARHIQHCLHRNMCAGSIFADGKRWEDIQGIQMSGNVIETVKKSEQLKAIGHYLAKFPFAIQFLSKGKANGLNLAQSVRMYRFTPMETFYTNNRLGFGKRVRVNLL